MIRSTNQSISSDCDVMNRELNKKSKYKYFLKESRRKESDLFEEFIKETMMKRLSYAGTYVQRQHHYSQIKMDIIYDNFLLFHFFQALVCLNIKSQKTQQVAHILVLKLITNFSMTYGVLQLTRFFLQIQVWDVLKITIWKNITIVLDKLRSKLLE